jgi:hypothetical protein
VGPHRASTSPQTGAKSDWHAHGLVEPFHLAAGLRMVGPGMGDLDPAQPELHLQGDPAVAALFAGEDRPVEFLTDVKLRRGS